MLQECESHKSVQNLFLTKEMMHDLMVSQIFLQVLMNLKLSIYQTAKEKLTTMLRQTKLNHWGGGWKSSGGSAVAGDYTSANWIQTVKAYQVQAWQVPSARARHPDSHSST